MAGRLVRCRELCLLLMVFPWAPSPSLGFNLETRGAQVIPDPFMDTRSRETYFGFSVALLSRHEDNSAWLLVGAPRANSSHLNPRQITEPGVLFKCSLAENGECEEMYIDQSGNTQISNLYHDHKNHGWLGGAMDLQPTYKDDRQVTGVCAPRWKNQHELMYLMNGACYWLNSSLTNAPAYKMLPLIEFGKQSIEISRTGLYFYAHGEAGFSIHFPDDPTEMIIGAPGVFNWKGSVIRIKDASDISPGIISRRRRRRQARTSDHQMFTTSFVLNPHYTANIHDFDLMGYAITSGTFLKEDQLCYASGAPRGANSYGKVFIFTFPQLESESLNILAEWQGTQLGEYFGAALVAADINGDGLSDLVVGSPMYSLPDMPDIGQIKVYLSSKGQVPQISNYVLDGSRSSYARFGTTLGSPGDLNFDGFHDVVAGAPWEGDGAVYVYMGSANGLRQVYSQRITPEDFPQGLKGFGMAFSRGVDIDSNDYPDLAIGSFMSGHAVVVKSRPVASLTGYITATPSTIALKDTVLQLETRIEYAGHKVPRQAHVKGNITLDYGFPSARAYFTDTNTHFRAFNDIVTINQTKLTPYSVTVQEDKVDARQPLLLKLEYELSEVPDVPVISQPKLDPGMASSLTSRVSIVTGCEQDGDDTCLVDMHLEMRILEYGAGKKFVIGEGIKPVLEVVVYNIGEPVFLPNMTVTVKPPLELELPTSHNCEFSSVVNRSSLVCHLANPILKDGEDKVEVVLDPRQLTDHSRNGVVDVQVSGEGQEIRPEDNIFFQELQFAAHASLKLHGYSKEEQVLYQRLGDDKINTTVMPRFIHSLSVLKNGSTPLEQVELMIHIPFSFTDGQNFVKIYAPETNFIRQPFMCNLINGSYSVDTTENGDGVSDVGSVNFNTTGIFDTTSNPNPPKSGDQESVSEKGIKDTQDFNCSSGNIKCALLHCFINSWPEGASSAKISIKLDVDLAVLAGHISAKAGAVLKSQATATISSLNPELAFVGEKDSSVVVVTHIQPDTLAGRGIPWWVILLAILGGILLLGLLVYGLHKAGFFKRKEYEEMKAHQAHVESFDNYGATNVGLIRDK